MNLGDRVSKKEIWHFTLKNWDSNQKSKYIMMDIWLKTFLYNRPKPYA